MTPWLSAFSLQTWAARNHVSSFLTHSVCCLLQMLENEMDVHADNLKSIVEQGREMAKAGHFDSAAILQKVDAFDRRYVRTNQPRF